MTVNSFEKQYSSYNAIIKLSHQSLSLSDYQNNSHLHNHCVLSSANFQLSKFCMEVFESRWNAPSVHAISNVWDYASWGFTGDGPVRTFVAMQIRRRRWMRFWTVPAKPKSEPVVFINVNICSGSYTPWAGSSSLRIASMYRRYFLPEASSMVSNDWNGFSSHSNVFTSDNRWDELSLTILIVT